MKSYIKAIVIFNDNGEKRYVDFLPGVNIITGDSKKGKSALVEIIDYCLCSSSSTIPKGIITEFGQLYCLSMVVGDKCLNIARKAWEQGGKMSIKIEEANFPFENLSYDYFNEQFIPSKDVQYAIERELGLRISNITDDENEHGKKASLRNMVPFLFQHQNLMASKFAIFYRFNDYYKRKDTIEQFPVFAGFIGQDYYSMLIKLNDKKKELKKLQKEEVKNKEIKKELKEKLIPLFEDYYALVNKKFDNNKSIKELIELSRSLPKIDLETCTSLDIVSKYEELKSELHILREEETELSIKLNELYNTNNTGGEYIEVLEELKEKTQISRPEKDSYNCPLCGKECEEINKISNNIFEADNWLLNEQHITSIYKDNFSEEIRKLEKWRDNIQNKIRKVYGRIKYYERTYFSSDKLNDLQEKTSYAKAKIELYIETINTGVFDNVNEDINKIKSEIEILKQKIDEFNLEAKKNEAKNYINNNMNRLAAALDFEEEHRPINLKFDIETFDLYHQNNNGKIYLSEMGSGANWVSCHISLFLSLLRFFTNQKNKSSIPSILFFDQPSQVYFPRLDITSIQETESNEEEQIKKQNDIEAVNKMYKTIFDEVTDIQNDTGIVPQVIIVDHVDGTQLKIKDIFKEKIRRNWRGEGTGLI